MTGQMPDGTPITTIDPEGPQQGQEVGRLWLYGHPAAPERWTYYEFGTTALAQEMYSEAMSMDRTEFDLYATLRWFTQRKEGQQSCPPPSQSREDMQ